MNKWFLITVIIVLVLGAGGTWLWRQHSATDASAAASSGSGGPATNGPATSGPAAASGSGRRGGMGGGPATVSVATAAAGELAVTRNAIGTIVPLALVTVRAQVAGRLDRVLYSEGQMVEAGDALAEIDARPFALAQAQYQGQAERDQAQLTQAELDLVRYRKLVEQDSLAHQQLDSQSTLVAQLRGTVAIDTAQIETAKLNQSYCRVTAPIAGRLGLRLVDAGNYVTPGDASGLVTITQMSPISVTYALPEVDLPLVLARIHAGEALTITVFARDGVTRLASGSVATIDNAIDATTGTIKLRAQLKNDEMRLFPNQFVNVRIDIERHHAAVTVPMTAVQRGPQGNFVWLITDSKASQRAVQVGLQTNDLIEITTGLNSGDAVVVDGVDRLREGSPVVAVPVASPGAAPAAGGTNADPAARPHRAWDGTHKKRGGDADATAPAAK